MTAFEVFYIHPHTGKMTSEIVYTHGEFPELRIPATFRRKDLDK